MNKEMLLLIVLIFTSLCTQSESNETRFVSRVIDGDTIELEDGERVRLIGIDATEFGDGCHDEATEKLEELILNKNIILESDVRNLDDYGRSLRYIYLGNMFVNFEMVRSGYAFTWPIEPNTKYSDEFESAEIYADTNNIGCLWG